MTKWFKSLSRVERNWRMFEIGFCLFALVVAAIVRLGGLH